MTQVVASLDVQAPAPMFAANHKKAQMRPEANNNTQMSPTRPGCLYLACRATLEEPRAVPGKPRSVIFDALLFCAKATNDTCLIPCSLRYFKPDDGADVKEGIYDIFATVRFAFTIIPKYLLTVAI